jgi:transposase
MMRNLGSIVGRIDMETMKIDFTKLAQINLKG